MPRFSQLAVDSQSLLEHSSRMSVTLDESFFHANSGDQKLDPEPAPASLSSAIVRTLNFDNKAEAVSFSSDGKLMLVGIASSLAVMFNTSTWEKRFEIGSTIHKLPRVLGLGFSNDCKSFATGCDQTREFDTASGKMIVSFDTGHELTRTIKFSTNDQKLVCGCGDHHLYVCDVPSQTILQRFENEDLPYNVCFGHDDKQLFWAAGEDGIKFSELDISGNNYTTPTQIVSKAYYACAVSNDQSMLGLAGGDQAEIVSLSDDPLQFLAQISKLAIGAGEELGNISFLPGDTHVVSSIDFETRIFEVLTGATTNVITGHTTWVYDFTWNQKTNQLATASWDNTVRINGLQTSALVASSTLDKDTKHMPKAKWFNMLAVSRSSTAISCDSNGTMYVAHLCTGESHRVGQMKNPDLSIAEQETSIQVHAVSFSKDETSLWAIIRKSRDCFLLSQPLKQLEMNELIQVPVNAYNNNGCGAVSFAKDASMVAIGDVAKQAMVVFLEKITPGNLEEHIIRFPEEGPVSATALTSNGNKLAVGTENGDISVYDVQNRTRLRKVVCDSLVQTLCFSKDGRNLASGSFNGTVTYFGLPTHRKEELLVTSSNTPIYDVAIINDGRTVASCSVDGVSTADISTGERSYHCYSKSDSPAHQLRELEADDNQKGMIAVSYKNGDVCVLDLTSRQPTVIDVNAYIDDNDIAAITRLIELYPALVNDSDPQTGETPLHRATRQGKLEILTCLLEGKQSAFVILDKAGKSVFDIAVDENIQDVVELLLMNFVLKVPLDQREPLTRVFHKLVRMDPDLTERFLSSLSISEVSTTEDCAKAELSVTGYRLTGSNTTNDAFLWANTLQNLRREKTSFLQQLQHFRAPFFGPQRKAEPVSGYITGLPNIAGPFKNLEESPLHVIVKHDLHTMLGTATMRAALDFKWDSFARREYLRDAMFFVVYTVLFTIFVLVSSFNGDMSLHEFHMQSSQSHMRLGLSITVWILLLLYAKSEFTQLRYYKIKYFYSFWNYADMGAIFSAGAVVVLHITRSEGEFSAGAVATLFHMFKSLSYARAFRATGPFVRMVFVILQDMVTLLTILAVLVIGFSFAFYLVNGTEEESIYRNFSTSLLLTFCMVLGDLDISNFEGPNYSLNIALFVIFMSIVYIVLMNMLIALMNNSFAKVIESIESQWRLEQGKIIVDIEREMSAATSSVADPRYSDSIQCFGSKFDMMTKLKDGLLDNLLPLNTAGAGAESPPDRGGWLLDENHF